MGLNVKKFNSRTFGNLRLHIDPEERKSHGHDNKDIDVTKTDQNYSFGCSSWDECTEALRKRNDEVDRMIPPQRLRSDRVIAVGTCIYVPDGLPEEKEPEFFKYVYDCMLEKYGPENVHAGFVHVDEKHEYINYKTGRIEESKNHMHVYMSPYTAEKGINGSAFVTKNMLKDMQFDLDAKVYEKFGVHMVRYPEGKSPFLAADWSVENIKQSSQQKAIEIIRRMEITEQELEKHEEQLKGFLGQKKKTYSISREDLEKLIYSAEEAKAYAKAAREINDTEQELRERAEMIVQKEKEFDEKNSELAKQEKEAIEKSEYRKLIRSLEKYIPDYKEQIKKRKRQERERRQAAKKKGRKLHTIK